MYRFKTIITLFTLIYLAGVANPVRSMTPNLGSVSCNSLLLVSSWTHDNVKIFDGCSGEFIKDLDNQNLIKGPLGILEAPDGDLLVISEINGRLLKFDRQTLSKGKVVLGDDPVTTQVEKNFISKPVGAVIDKDGFMYAASYGLNSVVKINTKSWQIVDEMLPANNQYIKGIDAGMVISEDGHLFLPGYDSDNIIKLNLRTKLVTSVVSAGSHGLDAPRTILFRGDKMLVTSERSNALMVFDANTGAFKKILAQVARPTGLKQDGEGHILVNTADAVFRLVNDGNSYEKIVKNGAGGLAGGTFVYRLTKLKEAK